MRLSIIELDMRIKTEVNRKELNNNKYKMEKKKKKQWQKY